MVPSSFISAHRALLRSCWISDKPIGSNPISPGMVPSSFSGRVRNGIDLDISAEFKVTDPARGVCADGEKAAAHATKEAIQIDWNPILKIYISSFTLTRQRQRCTW